MEKREEELAKKKAAALALIKKNTEEDEEEKDNDEEEDDEKPAKKKKRLVVVDERTVNFASNFCVCKRVWGSNLMSLVFLMTGSVVQAFGANDGTETSKMYGIQAKTFIKTDPAIVRKMIVRLATTSADWRPRSTP